MGYSPQGEGLEGNAEGVMFQRSREAGETRLARCNGVGICFTGTMNSVRSITIIYMAKYRDSTIQSQH